MDPADPVKFMEGSGYVFEGWDGAGTGKEKVISVRVDGHTKLSREISRASITGTDSMITDR